jgi:Zn-dependent peptidase ImmA (M78 family)/transcriptional regulator with XRE-family HTH domain
MPNVNPEILVWTRESAGLSLEDAAKALHLGGARTSGADALAALERGEKVPTRPQILKMVNVYRRPLLVFYLDKPPAPADRGEDFRTLPPEHRQENVGALDALVRDVHVRQQLVRTALEDAEEAQPHPFVGSINLQMPIADVIRTVVARLGFDRDTFRRKRNPEDAFTYLRDLIESTGVFVLLMGNLGSHHSNISAEVFRGFAIADDIAPFMVVNDQDAKSAWSFTALHELIHIWLGQTGISGGFPEQRAEKFCNDVASRILLDDDELDTLDADGQTVDALVADIERFARARNVSRPMVSYRLLQRRLISRDRWQELAGKFREAWARERANRQKGAPDYYTVRRHRLGGALLQFVKRTVDEGILTPTKAGRVLGVKPLNVATLLGAA